MEIKEFVKEAISDISDAVSELNNEKRDGGLVVNPCKYILLVRYVVAVPGWSKIVLVTKPFEKAVLSNG